MAAITWSAWSSGTSTNPNPFERPVARSIITLLARTSAEPEKKSAKSLSVVAQGKLPTYRVLLTNFTSFLAHESPLRPQFILPVVENIIEAGEKEIEVKYRVFS